MMQQTKLEVVIVEKNSSDSDELPSSCTCFWGSRLDLSIVNDRYCVACGRTLKEEASE